MPCFQSTGYSSRVETPDIQKVAQYLLHKNPGGTSTIVKDISGVCSSGRDNVLHYAAQQQPSVVTDLNKNSEAPAEVRHG